MKEVPSGAAQIAAAPPLPESTGRSAAPHWLSRAARASQAPMLRYVVRRVLLAVPTMIGCSLVVFLTIKLIPGDPIAALLGPRATPAGRLLVASQYGLGKALPVQYLSWLWHALRGDFGQSITQQRAVLDEIAPAFANTLKLTAFAAVVAVIGGTLLAGVIAFSRRRPVRALATFVARLAASTPQYTLGTVLIVIVALDLGWLPAGGIQTGTGGSGAADLFKHLVLPGLTAAIIPLGVITRLFAAALANEAAQPYVESDRARGLPETRVRLHILRASLASLLTISGLQIGYLLGGVVFVEVIFSWPGIGQLTYLSISERDYPVIQAAVLLAALGFVVLNLVVDVLRAALDPRVRRSGIVG